MSTNTVKWNMLGWKWLTGAWVAWGGRPHEEEELSSLSSKDEALFSMQQDRLSGSLTEAPEADNLNDPWGIPRGDV